MKALLQLHLINTEEDRNQAGLGSKPRLRSIVSGLTPEGSQGADQEEWRPNAGESQFDCFVREFKEQYEEIMPEFFLTPDQKPEPANKSTGKGKKATRKK